MVRRTRMHSFGLNFLVLVQSNLKSGKKEGDFELFSICFNIIKGVEGTLELVLFFLIFLIFLILSLSFVLYFSFVLNFSSIKHLLISISSISPRSPRTRRRISGNSHRRQLPPIGFTRVGLQSRIRFTDRPD